MEKPGEIPKGQFVMVVPNVLTGQVSDEANIAFKLGAWTVLILPSAEKQQESVWAIFHKQKKIDKSVLLIMSLPVCSPVTDL